MINISIPQSSPSLSSLDGSSAPEYEEKHVGFTDSFNTTLEEPQEQDDKEPSKLHR